MSDVTIDERVVQLVLACIGLAAFAILLAERIRLARHWQARDMSRLLLIDALLLIVGIELVADALILLLPHPWDDAATAVAFAARGALIAGAIALVMTVEWRRERHTN
jgi:hypothetical protein